MCCFCPFFNYLVKFLLYQLSLCIVDVAVILDEELTIHNTLKHIGMSSCAGE